MTHKKTEKADKPSGETEQDFAALADQWADKNWYLPPGGDHSWREREARRLFGGDGEGPVNDKEYPPPGWSGPPTDEADRLYAPGFKHGRALGIVLPVSLAACALLFIPIFMPQILTSDFWVPYEPKAPSVAPVQMMSQAAVEDDAKLRPAYGDGSDQGKPASLSLPQEAGPAAAPIKIYRNTVLPNPRPASIARDDRKDNAPAARVVKMQSPQAPSSKERAAKSLPPIGAAYFASHAPAGRKQMADSTRPIGQAYFESHSPASTD